MAPRSFFPLILTLLITCCLQATTQAQDTASEPASDPSAVESKTSQTSTWTGFKEAFESGVLSYQNKNFEEALTAFNFALEKDPSNVQALTNLALVQFQLGQLPWSVALLRKAHNLDPDFSTPRAALEFILPQLGTREIPHEIQFWETFRSSFLVPFPLNSFLAMTALCLLGAGWLWLHYLGQRRQAFQEEKPLPSFPLIATFAALIFLSGLTLSALKIWDLNIPRGTIVSEKVTVYSAPDDKSAVLFDLFGGLEVIMKSSSEQWVQVNYPGALTGWVPKSSVFQTSGSAR
jgi:tetratricopeptide (TPR) repeat protein